MKRLILALSLFTIPAAAQQQTLQQHIDAASAEATSILADLRGMVIQQANTMIELRQQLTTVMKERDLLKDQLAVVTKERDALKAAAAKPAEKNTSPD